MNRFSVLAANLLPAVGLIGSRRSFYGHLECIYSVMPAQEKRLTIFAGECGIGEALWEIDCGQLLAPDAIDEKFVASHVDITALVEAHRIRALLAAKFLLIRKSTVRVDGKLPQLVAGPADDDRFAVGRKNHLS